MKILFIYLAVVLAVVFYVWVNIIKEGNQDTDMSALNILLASTYTNVPGQNRDGSQATTEKDTSPDILKSNKVTPGITTIDRYADPMCSTNEYIYCLDGQIECQDIFGDLVNNNIETINTEYKLGNTFKNTCDSYIDKINLSDYSKIETDTTAIGTGVYFDLSNCPQDKPWRSGGVVETVGKIDSGSINPYSYTCHESQLVAENEYNALVNNLINEDKIYKKTDEVFILASYIRNQNIPGITDLLKVLDQKKDISQMFTTINNQKYYYGIIDQVTNDTYTVKINGDTTNPFSFLNVPKSALLKNSLYNKKGNDYYSDLKTGSHKRPVCKSGRFTSCLSSPPFSIKNGVYVSESDPSLSFYTDGSDPNMERKLQSQNSSISYTPFVDPPINPSGIIDTDTTLLEYNYFKTGKETPTPFIKCIADHGSNIGDPLCCNQTGYVEDTKYICPQEVPICRGYSENTYGYCN
jgi:hypothetical protein